MSILWFEWSLYNIEENANNGCSLCDDIFANGKYEKVLICEKEEHLSFEPPKNLRYFNCSRPKIIESKESKLKKSAIVPLLHIQKTSGTSLENDLATECCENYDLNHNCQVKFFFKTSGSCENDTKVFSTGYKCGYHPDLRELYHCTLKYMQNQEDIYPNPDQARQSYVTILRDPVHRVVSEYYHLYNSHLITSVKNDGLWDYPPEFIAEFTETEMTLEQFINHPLNHANNRQILTILGAVWNDSNPYTYLKKRIHRFDNWVELYNLSDRTEFHAEFNRHEELVKFALEILEEYFVWVGSVDYMCESLVVFNHLFNTTISTSSQSHLVSKTPQQFEFTDDLSTTIREKNLLDTLLLESVNRNILQEFDRLAISNPYIRQICSPESSSSGER